MPSIEYVTLANHAEAINGLLYLSGAGWSEIRPPVQQDGSFAIVHFGIGLSVLVGWNETNQRFAVEITIVHEDGGDPIVRVDGQIEQGRPPGLTPGSDLRSVVAIDANVQFPRPGGYEVRATILDQVRTASFRVYGPPPGAANGPTGYRLPGA
jgi:hypothetical protein